MPNPEPSESVADAVGPPPPPPPSPLDGPTPEEHFRAEVERRLRSIDMNLANLPSYPPFPPTSYEPPESREGLEVEIRLRAFWPDGEAKSRRTARLPGIFSPPQHVAEGDLERVGHRLELAAHALLQGQHVVVLPEALYMECPTCGGKEPEDITTLCTHCRGVGLVPKPAAAFMGQVTGSSPGGRMSAEDFAKMSGASALNAFGAPSGEAGLGG